MDTPRHFTSADGARLISAFGAIYLAVAAVQMDHDFRTVGPLSEILIDFVLLVGPSIVLLYGGYWLSRSAYRPGVYPRIVGWCVGGLVVMFSVFGLLVLNPDSTVTNTLRSAGILTAFGCVGGLGVGLKEAQALTRAAEAEEREQALQESKKQLRTLIELLPVAVFVAEADGRIVEWNEAAEAIWGGEVAESESVAEYDRYDGWWADTGEPLEPDEWALARALQGEAVTDPDVIEIEGFDGERRTVLNHGMPIRDEDGTVKRAVVTLIDITERTEYQRRLKESNERLERFAYAASHDLQEPLRMVSSYLQLIERRYGDELDDEGQEYIEFAVDGAERMREMIDGLLDYSRVDIRDNPFESVELDAVLADAREALRVKTEESNADITVDPLPRVYGNEEQLRQLFRNLLENAIKYSGDEPPRIAVSAERDGDEYTISIRDDGIGIDEDDTERIFDVFESLHAPDEYTGSGIGLALCKRIVENHGGEIRVDSASGDGSTFYVTIPSHGDDRTRSPAPQARREPHEGRSG